MDPMVFPSHSAEPIASSTSNAYISPLHEALIGTSLAPSRDDLLAAVFPPRPPSPPVVLAPAPPGPESVAAAAAGFGAGHIVRPQLLPLLQHDFMVSPVTDYLTDADRLQIFSMQPPPFTSVLQGDPMSVMHAHLAATGETDLGPIFQGPMQNLVPEASFPVFQDPMQNLMPDAGLPLVAAPFMPVQGPAFAASQLHQPPYDLFAPPNFNFPPGIVESSIENLRSSLAAGMQPAVPAGYPTSALAGLLQPILDLVGPAARAYVCKTCGLAFTNARAFGGHMSYHSKVKRSPVPWKSGAYEAPAPPEPVPVPVLPPGQKLALPRVAMPRHLRGRRAAKRAKVESPADAATAAVTESVGESSAGPTEENGTASPFEAAD